MTDMRSRFEPSGWVRHNGFALLLAFCLGALHELGAGQGARDVKPAG